MDASNQPDEAAREKTRPEPNGLSDPDNLCPAPVAQPTAVAGQGNVSPTNASPRGTGPDRRPAPRRKPGAGGPARRRLANAAKCGNSERGLRNTVSGRLCQSVRAGKISPCDRDVLHAETVRLFRAKPVKFVGPHGQQTIQHLRYLQRAIISLIAQTS